MAGEYTLSVLLKAQDAASSVVQGFLSHLGPVGDVIATVGGALLGVGVQSVKMAANFQESMTQLVTGAGESQKNIGLVSNGILDMAVQTGTTTTLLAQGMYMVESAGYHGAAGLQVLQVAAEGAKVGNADLGVVANSLTSVLTDYHMKSTQAASAMNGLIATVANGKTHLQDLANSMGTVLPLASSLGISFPQVAGAIAEMTNAGMPAQRASMNLANAIRSLGAPSATATKAMASVGLSAQQLKDTLSTQGLTGVIQLIEKHIGETFPAGSVQSVQAFKAIMGGATGYNVALMLGGKNMQSYEGNVSKITKAMQSGKGQVQGWSLVQQDFNFKIAQAKEVVETLMIRIGTALLPVLTKLMNQVIPIAMQFANWITKSGILNTIAATLSATIGRTVSIITTLVGAVISVVGWFAKGSPAALALRDALIAVGAAIAIIKIGNFIATIPMLLAQLSAWLAATWAQVAAEVGLALAEMAANWPIYLIIAGVLLLIGIVILLVKHWGAVIAFLRGAWQAFSSWFMAALHAVGAFFTSIWNGIKNFFVGLWTSVVGFFKSHILLIIAIVTGPLGALIILIITHWSQIKAFFTGLWQDVVGIVHTAVSWVENAVTSIWNTIVSIVTTWPGKALQWGKDLIQNLINGILSMLGGIGNAVGQVAGKIAGFLHFSKPDVGPLASVMSWMPDFGDVLAAGLVAQKGKLQAAVTTMVQPIAGGVSGATSAPQIGSGAPPISAASGSGGNTYVMNLTVNSQTKVTRQFVQEIEAELSAWLRQTGQQPATASGRRW